MQGGPLAQALSRSSFYCHKNDTFSCHEIVVKMVSKMVLILGLILGLILEAISGEKNGNLVPISGHVKLNFV